ncbi:ATP-binding protein [Candidatus Shapirobacteria bacterium]|nr:ATP-binding protein [Candidatus Shapirobacteria bacterium]
MRYLTRKIEKIIKRSSKTFKIVFLGGPRQVGKTTTLKRLSEKMRMDYVTLDDLDLRELANSDPKLFLQQYKAPTIIDEVQYAPKLFPQIKKIVDESDLSGRFWLTGSQQFSLIKNIQESLAGRVAILNILGLSQNEKKESKKNIDKPKIRRLFKDIFVGGFPVFQSRNAPDREVYFNSYIQTYLDRDLSGIFGINKTTEFNRFIQVCAARTGQVLNISDLARDCGISPVTATEWLNILENTMQIYLLKPFYPNITKRIIKAPKLYFLDTGLASYLTKWNNVESLLSGSMSGAMFETYVVGEVIKKYISKGVDPPLYYLRDKEGHEVDLVVEDNGLHLLEIKLSANVNLLNHQGLNYFSGKFAKVVDKTVVSLIENQIITTDGVKYVPYTTFVL